MFQQSARVETGSGELELEGPAVRAGRGLGHDRAALSCIEDCRDGFDFYQLVLVAEHGDAHQRTGDVVVAE